MSMTREEAIRVFEAWIEHDEKMKYADRLENIEIYKMAIEALKEQKRPHGEWIACKSTRNGQITNIDFKCSNCSHHKDRPVPYCEICGARMKRSEKE